MSALEDEDEDDFYDSGNVRDRAKDNRRPGPGDNSGDEDLSNLDLDDKLKLARARLLDDLIRAVTEGYATPQEKNTLRQMLKDNGMVLGDPFEGGSSAADQAVEKRELPTFTKPDYEQ